MNRSRAAPTVFLLVGITSLLIAISVLRPDFYPVDSGRELATVFIVVTSLGFVATGLTWLLDEDEERYRRIPAATVLALGASALLGGFVVFRPWEYGGLAFVVYWFWTLILAAVGIIYLGAGRQWIRRREIHYSLAFLASSLGISWFVVYHEPVLWTVPTPVFALIALGVAIVPFVATLSGIDRAVPAR